MKPLVNIGNPITKQMFGIQQLRVLGDFFEELEDDPLKKKIRIENPEENSEAVAHLGGYLEEHTLLTQDTVPASNIGCGIILPPLILHDAKQRATIIGFLKAPK